MAQNADDLRKAVQPRAKEQLPAEMEKPTPLTSVKALLERYKGEIQEALPAHITPDHLLRLAMMEFRLTPKLLECTPASLLGGVMTCARIGLEPGPLGHIFLVPYWSEKRKCYEAQVQVGYKGYVKLAYQSGLIESIIPVKIHAKDTVEVCYGSDPRFIHLFPKDWADRGDVIGYYIIVRFKGGGVATSRIWSLAEIIQHRDKYAQKSKYTGKFSDAWEKSFDQMALKTVWRDMVDYLPVSIEIASAAAADGSVKRIERAEDVDLPGELIGEVVNVTPEMREIPDASSAGPTWTPDDPPTEDPYADPDQGTLGVG